MNRSFLVTRSCTTSIFIYFSDLAGLSSAVRDFFFFFARADVGVGEAGAGFQPESIPPGPPPSARRGRECWWKEASLTGRFTAPPAATPRRLSLSRPRSLTFTHKHHSPPLGRRRRQPKEAGLQEESPLCAIQSGTWLRPGAAASPVTEE